MRNLIFWVIALCSFPASAGFQAYNSSTDLGIFDKIKCSTGLTCTRSQGKLSIVSSPTVSAGEFTVAGDEATDGVFNLKADEGDDSGDSWAFKSLASGNSLDFQNNTSGSLVTKLSLSTAGVLTLSDSETITDASDVVTLASDDAAANLTLKGFEANDAKLVLSADESDDNGDDWEIKAAASGNALTISNDTTGSQVAQVTIATTGEVTGTGAGAMSGFLEKQVAATATTITASQCGSTFYNSGAVVINLPNGAASLLGCSLTFVVANASNFDINPGNSDQILTLTNAAGDAIRNATKGGSVILQYGATNEWYVIGKEQGTWTDIN